MIQPAVAAPLLHVGLIGSGRRIRNNFLPAFSCLSDHAVVRGITSPTAAHRDEVARLWGIESCESVASLEPASLDVVCVSVKTDAVPDVLRSLLPWAANLALIVDTPVVGRATHLRATRLLRKFADVRVAEDYMNFPRYELLRTAVASGVIGDLQRVELHHNAYRYHGLALIRSLAEFAPVRSVRRSSSEPNAVSLRVRLRGGVVGLMTEPYDYGNGSLVVAGTNGQITHIEEVINTDGRLASLRIGERTLTPRHLVALQALGTGGQVADDRDFNHEKTCGLIRIIESFWQPDNLNCRYSYVDALKDHVVTAGARVAISSRRSLAAAR